MVGPVGRQFGEGGEQKHWGKSALVCVCVYVCVYGLRGEQGQTENISLARNKVPIGNKIA